MVVDVSPMHGCLCWQTLSMDKSHGGSGSASPAPLSSSPALKSTAIPETTESQSVAEQRQSEPPPAKTLRTAVTAAEPQDTDRSPLNVATSTLSEWFGMFTVCFSVFHCCRS